VGRVKETGGIHFDGVGFVVLADDRDGHAAHF
jgi:hypothetical protein